MKNNAKSKVFVLSKSKEVLNNYPEYQDQEIFYFEETCSVMDLVSFKPDYIIMPNRDEIINVSKVA